MQFSLREFKQAFPTTMLRELWRLLFLCAVVGLIAGLGAIVFYMMLDAGRWFFLEFLAGYHPALPGGEHRLIPLPETEFRRWVLFLVPAAGGLLSGIIVFSLAPEAEGHGTDAAIDSYHNRGGKVRARVPWVKAITAALTIGSGGSGGREGPIAQIGSGFGSMFANWLKLRPHERRVLMAAGMGAGVGAIFHAPLAGALFAAEVLYRELDLEYEVLVPTVISSITAYAVFASKFGWQPLFVTPKFVFQNPAELGPYFILALVVAAGASIFVKVFYTTRDGFVGLRIPNHVKPALGGLVVGAVGYFVPEAIGTGYGVIQEAFFAKMGVGTLLAVAFLKMVTTSFTIGSGGSGGVFGPAIVIGGALGGAVGLLMAQLFPWMNLQPGAFALVGMAGFFAAAANTPISTLIMVSEMTGNYHLLVPSMFVCFVAFMLCKKYTLYENQIATRFDAPANTGNMMKAVLLKIPVVDVIARQTDSDFVQVREGTNLRKLLELFAGSSSSSFPVVDEDGKLISMIHSRDLRSVVADPSLEPLVVAADLAHAPVTIRKNEDLFVAVQQMASNWVDDLLVVDDQDPERPLAILSRSDVVSAYHEVLNKGLTS